MEQVDFWISSDVILRDEFTITCHKFLFLNCRPYLQTRHFRIRLKISIVFKSWEYVPQFISCGLQKLHCCRYSIVSCAGFYGALSLIDITILPKIYISFLNWGSSFSLRKAMLISTVIWIPSATFHGPTMRPPKIPAETMIHSYSCCRP